MTIQQLSFAKYANVVKPLFHVTDPNLAAAFGIIEGLIPGQIWADDEDNPHVCLILCSDDNGLTPIYACDEANVASARAAEHHHSLYGNGRHDHITWSRIFSMCEMIC